jgi:hypothetical protein
MAVIMSEFGEFDVPKAKADGEDLWLSTGDAERATGWTLKPEGLCKGEVCVPLPAGSEGTLVSTGRINMTGFWRHLGRPVLHSDDGGAWSLGTAARERAAALKSLEAPDFALPDREGRLHRLSDHRGKKVLLVTWASW